MKLEIDRHLIEGPLVRQASQAARNWIVSPNESANTEEAPSESNVRVNYNRLLTMPPWLILRSSSNSTTFDDPVSDFLETVYKYQYHGDARGGIAYVLAYMNRLFLKQRLGLCDLILNHIDASQLETELLLAFLTITRAARGKLRYRSQFLEKTRGRIEALRGKEVAARLLEHMAG